MPWVLALQHQQDCAGIEADSAACAGQLDCRRLLMILPAMQFSMLHSSVLVVSKQCCHQHRALSTVLEALAFIAIASMLFSLK